MADTGKCAAAQRLGLTSRTCGYSWLWEYLQGLRLRHPHQSGRLDIPVSYIMPCASGHLVNTYSLPLPPDQTLPVSGVSVISSALNHRSRTVSHDRIHQQKWYWSSKASSTCGRARTVCKVVGSPHSYGAVFREQERSSVCTGLSTIFLHASSSYGIDVWSQSTSLPCAVDCSWFVIVRPCRWTRVSLSE